MPVWGTSVDPVEPGLDPQEEKEDGDQEWPEEAGSLHPSSVPVFFPLGYKYRPVDLDGIDLREYHEYYGFPCAEVDEFVWFYNPNFAGAPDLEVPEDPFGFRS
jgi:hypothetical protein